MWINGIDAIDNKIIQLLLDDGRMSYSDIAQSVGMTRTAVKNRIDELKDKGIIAGYKVILNPQKFPKMMAFIMNVETQSEFFEEAKKKLEESTETITIVQTTGNCHLLIVCYVSCVEEMRNFVMTAYNEIKGITLINVHAVLNVVKGSIIPENSK